MFLSYREFSCEGIVNGNVCGKTTVKPPMDAPPWFEEIWPEDSRVLTQLQAQHQTKDLTQNDDSVLSWMCPSCHKKEDQETEKGKSVIDQSMWG